MAIRIINEHLKQAFPLCSHGTITFYATFERYDTLLHCLLYRTPNKFGFDVSLMLREAAYNQGEWVNVVYDIVNMSYNPFMVDIL